MFLDVAKDRLYTLAPGDPARRSAQTVLWQALHDLAIAASPALVFTAEEVWQTHPAWSPRRESVHLADWPARCRAGRAEAEWELLLEVRDAVNAAIEPLRAAKTLATTTEAEVVLHAPAAMAARLARYADELAGFLIVARRARGRRRAGERYGSRRGRRRWRSATAAGRIARTWAAAAGCADGAWTSMARAGRAAAAS